MNSIYHEISAADHAIIQVMKAELRRHPALEFGPHARPLFEEVIAKTPSAENVRYETATVAGVPGSWCRPTDPLEGAAILYLHGGAYILGSAAAYRNFASHVASRARLATFIPDYRLAPEHPFPSALDDARAAYEGLVADGYSRVALAGDSAGGGLALSLLLVATEAAKSGSVPAPVAAAVMSPWTDLALTGLTLYTNIDADPLLRRDALEKAAHLYLGELSPLDARVSPLYGDLAGLAPVLMHVGNDEILLDDSRRFAQRMSLSGGSSELHVWEGMVHVFPANVESLTAAAEALDGLGEFLRSSLKSRRTQKQ